MIRQLVLQKICPFSEIFSIILPQEVIFSTSLVFLLLLMIISAYQILKK